MVASVDFSDYLRSLVEVYRPQPDFYTLTDLQVEIRVEKSRPDPQSAEREVKVERSPVLAGLRKYGQQGHVLLVGKTGSGKSTALRRLLWEEAQAAQADQRLPIPVLIALRGDRTIPAAICAEFRKAGLRVTPEQLDEWLLEGRLFLLLDGLNEIPSEALEHQVRQFRSDNPHTLMIFTSRELATGLEIQPRLEMCPLTEPQMRSFIEKYLPDKANELLGKLRDRLRELAETPLLLKLLCEVYDEPDPRLFGKVGDLRSKGELFQAIDRKYNTWKTGEGIRTAEKFWQWNRELLGYLAFRMLQADGRPTSKWLAIDKSEAERLLEDFLTGRVAAPGERAKDWLQDLLDYHLLQFAANPTQIEFRHPLFQEYYAAEYLRLQLFQLSDAQLQRNYLNLLKWTEPLAMMTALVKDDIQVVRIIRLALEVDFYLGGRLAGEAQISLQKATIDLLIQENFTQSLTIWLLEQTYSSCALPFLLDVLQNGSADNRWRAARALGNYSSTAVLEQLIGALQDPDSSVRYQAAKSLGKSGRVEAIPYLDQLLSDDENEENWLVRSVAVEALGEIKNTESTKCLKKALRNKDSTVRNKAAQYLGQRIPEDVVTLLSEEFFRDNSDSKSDVLTLLKETKNVAALPTLIHALSDDDWITRSHAALQIGSLGIWFDRNSLEEALIALIYTLQSDPDISVRSTAALSLGFIGNSQVVPLLIDALSQEEEIVRSSAINALEKLQDRTAIPALIRALQDNSYVCEAAIKALRTLNAVEALSQIRKLKHHKVADIRQEVILTLGFIGDFKDFPYLYQALNEREKFSTRLCAAYSLSNLNNRKGVKILENALRDGNEEARKLAILGLKNFQGKVGISSIFSNLLKESEYSLQKLSLDFLEPFKETSEIIDQLKIALDSSNEDICRNAMDTAKVLGNAEHLLCLRQLAATITVVERPLEAIAAIQANCQFYNYETFKMLSEPALSSPADLLSKIDKTTQETNERTKFMAEQPIISIFGGTFNGPVNLAPNQGHQPTTINNNYFGADDDLKKQTTELHQFIAELETKHPDIQTEAEADKILDAEIVAVQTNNPTRWQTLCHQMTILKRQLLNPERHFQAAKASIVEVTKAYWEKSLIVKAVITYLDKLSEAPDRGL